MEPSGSSLAAQTLILLVVVPSVTLFLVALSDFSEVRGSQTEAFDEWSDDERAEQLRAGYALLG
jgi:hypothetical protein